MIFAATGHFRQFAIVELSRRAHFRWQRQEICGRERWRPNRAGRQGRSSAPPSGKQYQLHRGVPTGSYSSPTCSRPQIRAAPQQPRKWVHLPLSTARQPRRSRAGNVDKADRAIGAVGIDERLAVFGNRNDFRGCRRFDLSAPLRQIFCNGEGSDAVEDRFGRERKMRQKRKVLSAERR